LARGEISEKQLRIVAHNAIGRKSRPNIA